MLICIAGKNNIAVDILDYLDKQNSRSYSLGITCNKNETGKNSWQKSLRVAAERRGIREYSLEELFEIEELIFLSLEYDRIIKPELFRSNRLYNIHFSLLPQYKGMYTSAIPILNGEKKIGVTFHKIDRGVDTGDIIAQREFELLDEYTCRDVYLKFIRYGTEVVMENIENVLNNSITAYPQPSEKSTYYSRKYIDYSNLKIDLNQTAVGIQRQIRAFSFREYQMPEVHGHKIIETYITNIKSKLMPGSIIYEDTSSILMTSIDYNIILYKDRFPELMQACKHGNFAKVMEICSIKRHINTTNIHGWSPLTVATYNNHIDIVKYLIALGADIYVTNNNGTTLLMYAKDAYLNTGDGTLLELYVTLGLSAYEKDYSDKDIFDYIEMNVHTAEKKEYLLNTLTCKYS